MQVFVKNNQTYIFDVENETTILEFKRMIFDKIGLPIKYQYLTSCGRNLCDNLTLKDYNILKNTTFFLSVRA